VFWQVGSSATLGTTTAFKGNILALTSITLNTGATVSGRTLARNAAVTLDGNAISILGCATVTGGGSDAGVGVDGGASLDAGVPVDASPDAGVPVDGNVDAEVPIDCGLDAG
jgi:hypothetical protein